METCCVYVRVARRDIGLLCSLMAGYEGVAIVRTMDARQGLVELLVAPAFYQTLLDIIQALTADIALSLLPREEVDSVKCQGTSVEPPTLSTGGVIDRRHGDCYKSAVHPR